MKIKVIVFSVLVSLFCVGVLTSSCCLAKDDAPEVPVLTKKGLELEARYTKELDGLREKIKKALPNLDAKKVAVFLKAGELERATEVDRDTKEEELKANEGAKQRFANDTKWVSSATPRLAEAKKNLKAAEAMSGDKKAEAVKAAEKELADAEKNFAKATTYLKESKAAAEVADEEHPKCVRALEDTEKKLVKDKDNAIKTLKALNVDSFLASDKLDPMLLKFQVISEATPGGLARFAQRGVAEEKLIAALLKDTKLMRRMLVADGAKSTKHHKNKEGFAYYGKALEIYNDIKKSSKNMTKAPVLQRLALACALEHAVPIGQRNPEEDTDASPFVDPVKRYLHFEKAFLDGELDAVFKDLGTWELRFVVNGNEPEETLTWGRKMLRNYRPDHVLKEDFKWRYVDTVRSDISYGSQYNKYDEPRLQFYQNILKNGGVCGRRAFFGRFILRAYGIPVIARPQHGHAALAHWTPDGWVVCLGARWGKGSSSTPYRKDLNFLESSQAREDADAYLKVKRAHWIANVLGETPMLGLYGHNDPVFGLWTSISLYTQRAIIKDLEAKTLAAVGTASGESNELMKDEEAGKTKFTDEDKTIVVAKDGTITIPAAACSTPANSTNKILFMESLLGGKQLHYAWRGDYEPFEYVFDVPKAGNYELTMKFVTPSWKQNLVFSVNGGKQVNIDLPYTLGMWETTKPVKIALKQGENRLQFTRVERQIEDARDKGISIREFTLKPTK